jgi:hypothetical protein
LFVILFVICVFDVSVRDEQPVRIRLTDVNDELPVFKNVPRPFLATVSANAAPGTSVYQLMAQDADDDSVVRYMLESGTSRASLISINTFHLHACAALGRKEGQLAGN